MKSKNLLLAGFFIVFSLQLFAQRPRFQPQVHEIGVQVYTLRSVPYYWDYQPEGFLFSHNPLSGLRYKYHLDVNTALRSGLFYHRADYFLAEDPYMQGMGPFEASFRGGEATLGIEKKLPIKRIQLFAGVDVLLGYGQTTEKASGFNVVPIDRSLNVFNYGASGVLGIRYFFNSYVSFSLESSMQYLWTNNPRTQIGEPLVNLLELRASNAWSANPISVYFSYHFVKMKKKCKCWHPRR